MSMDLHKAGECAATKSALWSYTALRHFACIYLMHCCVQLQCPTRPSLATHKSALSGDCAPFISFPSSLLCSRTLMLLKPCPSLPSPGFILIDRVKVVAELPTLILVIVVVNVQYNTQPPDHIIMILLSKLPARLSLETRKFENEKVSDYKKRLCNNLEAYAPISLHHMGADEGPGSDKSPETRLVEG